MGKSGLGVYCGFAAARIVSVLPSGLQTSSNHCRKCVGDHFLIFDHEQVRRQRFAEAAMDFAHRIGGEVRSLRPPLSIHCWTPSNGRFGLTLEFALLGILAVTVFEGAFDIDRVDCPVIRTGCCRSSSSRARDRQVRLGPRGRAVPNRQRFHQAQTFVLVSGRFNVPFIINNIFVFISLLLRTQCAKQTDCPCASASAFKWRSNV